jgi:hypothetical protein
MAGLAPDMSSQLLDSGGHGTGSVTVDLGQLVPASMHTVSTQTSKMSFRNGGKQMKLDQKIKFEMTQTSR